jgi:uncharacterized protein (TIGR02452 family)
VVLFSAVALALVRLQASGVHVLRRFSIEIAVNQTSDISEYCHELATKVAAAQASPCPANQGLFVRKNDGFQWIRKENDPESRLQRLRGFFVTQRAVWRGFYALDSARLVQLTSIVEMIKGTRLVQSTDIDRHTGASAAARLPTLMAAQDFPGGWDGSVASLACSLTSQGLRTVAVSAASAYQHGGGVSSGGRHALEEAWCMTSTLYCSLAALKSDDVGESNACTTQGYRQHIPTNSCVVSPSVEIFRDGTSNGYKLFEKPTCICGVISVALFNRNPSISDSPLDSPADPSLYISQTRAKLNAVIQAAAQLGAEALVIPDMGCGVFKNDPLLVGSCLGTVLRFSNTTLKRVVIASANTRFFAACKRSFEGQDPRPPCDLGVGCDRGNDMAHVARFLHVDTQTNAGNAVDDVLLAIVRHPEDIQKPECKYGKYCHITSRDHLARFSHPESISAGAPERAPTVPSKPLCRYGKDCYNNNQNHVEAFSHPWREQPTHDQTAADALQDQKFAHDLLSRAKDGAWAGVRAALTERPKLVNVRPPNRKWGLIHYAVYQMKLPELFWLVTECGADVKMLTSDNMTPEDVLKQAIKEAPAKDSAQRDNDRKLVLWIQERAAGRPVKPPAICRPATTQSKQGEAVAPRAGAVAISYSSRRDLEGVYTQMPALHNGRKAYQTTSQARRFLFYCVTSPFEGWNIREQIIEKGEPLAYLRRIAGSDDVCGQLLGASWNVFTPSEISPPGFFKPDAFLSVRPAA